MTAINRPPYTTPEDFMRGAKPCSVFDKLSKDLARESEGQLVDPVALRRGQDWSAVAYQVFGGEVISADRS